MRLLPTNARIGAKKIVTKFLWLPTTLWNGERFETRWLKWANIWYEFKCSWEGCYWEAKSWAN